MNSESCQQAVTQLKEGNARFVAGKSIHPNLDQNLREKLATSGQHPVAAVLACSDSRAPVELLFDQGLGDLFVIRVAGGVAGPDQLGSLEYAVEHLKVPLVLVLGHTGCGAISAAVSKHQAPGALGELLARLDPVVKSVEHLPSEEQAPKAVGYAVKHALKEMTSLSQVLAKAVEKGQTFCLGAIYNMETGQVIFDET